MASSPEGSYSSKSSNYTSSFTADDFRQYEERMNSSKAFVNSAPASQHTIGDEQESAHSTCQPNVKHETHHSGSTLVSLPPKQSGGFSADSFRQYEQRLNESKPVTEPTKVFQVPGGTVDEKAPFKVSVDSSSRSSTSVVKPEAIPLPNKRQSRLIRAFRHTFWNVYRRLFSLVFAANVIALIVFLCRAEEILSVNVWHLATAASANIFVGTTIRQDYVQNILYRTADLVPHSAPLRLRRIIAKIYENGGVHSGCGVAGTMWFIALTVVLTVQFAKGLFTSRAVLILTYLLQALLLMILVLAYPALRFKFHNHFEMTHRFAGWMVIILFWIELGLLADISVEREHMSAALVLAKQPSFWFLVVITVHTIVPWLNLRRWEFEAENLSNHAVRLHFKKTPPPFTGIAISKSPLFEWHPFATMPSLDSESPGGSLIVSAAGDWTKDAVERPRKYYWVKGIPKPGVLGLSLIFKRVVIVTTGSGIGPCLSILASPYRRMACRVLWSGPSPEKVFGSEIVDTVRRVDPLAVIIDSRTQGRPDMVALTYRLYVESAAEAVFVISNPVLTRKIVYSMESRGVPAFGPVWDS